MSCLIVFPSLFDGVFSFTTTSPSRRDGEKRGNFVRGQEVRNDADAFRSNFISLEIYPRSHQPSAGTCEKSTPLLTSLSRPLALISSLPVQAGIQTQERRRKRGVNAPVPFGGLN
ncbi:hypothetical protein FQA47_014881 [Oryzias melastigma]|uniref:Uncharacterized protein n=1 Tax=Oryzias melastigma TaxID=30732 RepID=A0A834BZK5_ORYME|nr:hypothetical protein FQA47_014881 [Oryzias melastigma]